MVGGRDWSSYAQHFTISKFQLMSEVLIKYSPPPPPPTHTHTPQIDHESQKSMQIQVEGPPKCCAFPTPGIPFSLTSNIIKTLH